MLAEGSVQEVMDLAGVAHLATIKSRARSELLSMVSLLTKSRRSKCCGKRRPRPLIDQEALAEFRARALNPMNGCPWYG